MIYLNGEFIPLERATISVLDRGFLFADGIYEVVPVYKGQPFRLSAHLKRLQHSLDALAIKNPYKPLKWQNIIAKLIDQSPDKTLAIYIQITRGRAHSRQHIEPKKLKPTILAKPKKLKPPTLAVLKKPHYAITQNDIRWHRCDIKSIALLGNILLLQAADKQGAEEALLIRDNIITEGASSNVFIVKNGTVYTHPANEYILAGITRDAVIESIKNEQIPFKEQAFSAQDLARADEIWITSATKEITPITHLNKQVVGTHKPNKLWQRIYNEFQSIKNNEC